jgi:hypothetical protein
LLSVLLFKQHFFILTTMKTNYLLNLVTFLLLGGMLWSCSAKSERSEDTKRDFKQYPIGAECVETPEEKYHIKISESEQVAFEDLVDYQKGIRIVAIGEVPNEALFGEITKLWASKSDGIIFTDQELANKIYKIDNEGNLEWIIDKTGSGPGEFQKLWSVQLNPYKQQIEVWDLSLRKFLYYDLNGKFINERSFDHEIVSFFPVNGKGWYAFHHDGRDHLGKKADLITLSDSDLLFPIKKGVNEYGFVDTWLSQNEFDEYEGSTLFHHPLTDTIYWIGPVNGQICPTYVIDFGKDALSPEAKSQVDLMKAASMIQKDQSSYSLGELKVGSTYLHFRWFSESENKQYHQIVNRLDYGWYKIPQDEMELWGIYFDKVLDVDYQKITLSAYPYKIDKSTLQKKIEEFPEKSALRGSLEKVLQSEDTEKPFLIQLYLKHDKSDEVN